MRAEQPTTTELAAEIDALRAQLAQRSTGKIHTPRRRGRLPQRLRAIAAAGLLVALAPLGIMAAAPTFSDLGQAAPVHRADIQTIANAGITTGYDDPNSDDPNARIYDPQAPVTREQMASFLARLGGLNGYPAIANAASVANGGVTTAAISPAGSTAGQVLTSTGDGVAWQTVASGPQGPQGPIGPPGPPGPSTGANGLGGYNCGPVDITNDPPCIVDGPGTIAIPILVINTPQITNGYLDITVPSAGYLYVTTSATVQSASAANVDLFIVKGALPTDTPRSTVARQTLPGTIAAMTRITHTWVFPVEAGAVTIRPFIQSDTLGVIRVGEESSSYIFVPSAPIP